MTTVASACPVYVVTKADGTATDTHITFSSTTLLMTISTGAPAGVFNLLYSATINGALQSIPFTLTIVGVSCPVGTAMTHPVITDIFFNIYGANPNPIILTPFVYVNPSSGLGCTYST